ncbi:MAG TPA: RsmB/NOP family class I SAM-dependent RNA methyltransferase [Ottowia sp.]|uniref:RsmB/NOP family class I SAM-dependent RNA methyltransferase n=1 Tax=Ottowia sp. TaxID=1898956 RepID=UPI002D17E761|nr:RsmB/NOP family class I SAM-dependent RNA methyltransferase [Ottowia sp.]HMN21608.1 RsmB/NOP family class I SAM-dependent RNA methyltransferase [Ottowia sp.]
MHPKALLDTASELVLRVLRLQHPADAVVSRFFREQRQLGPRERATLAETAYAVLRRKPLYEHLARSGSGARERRLAMLGFAAPRDFLKSALSEPERRWLDACDAVAPADLPEACRHNLPAWLVAPLRAQLGDEFEALAEALLQPAPLDLRVNTLLRKRDAAAQELKAQGVAATPTPYSPWGLRVAGKPALQKLEAFRQGVVEVQDEGSQLLALLLDARRGEMVADFCAGAGGKTLAIGAAMRSTGRLYAFDVSAHRLDALGPRLKRSGLSNVHPVAIAHERDERIKRLAGKMDRVLVDAPCSGLGTLRRNPDLKWRQTPADVQELVARQRAILASSARLVKPGGRLVYATCSLLTDENEVVAGAFGADHPDFRPLPVAELLAGLKVADAAALCTPDGACLRLWPHRHGTDGFFAAAWQRA